MNLPRVLLLAFTGFALIVTLLVGAWPAVPIVVFFIVAQILVSIRDATS